MPDRKALRTGEVIPHNSRDLLDIRLNYALGLYDASINASSLTPEIQLTFRENIAKFMSLDERLELLRYLKFKARNYEIAGDKKEMKRYFSAADYLMMNFI